MRGAGRDDLVTICGPFTEHGMVRLEVIGPPCTCAMQHAYRFACTVDTWDPDNRMLIEAVLDVLYDNVYAGLRECAARSTTRWSPTYGY